MGGPIFAHIQTWSRKANPAGQSVAQIVAEATRDPQFSMHVDDPQAPRILVGDPDAFLQLHDDHVAVRSTSVTMKDGTVRTRSIRKDRHTMASIVMSYPVPFSAIRTDEDREKLERWERRNLAWLQETYGDQVKVVLAHDDEEHPHLHAWLLSDDPGADATMLHPGKVAKKLAEDEAKAEGKEPREAVKLGNRALKAAMTTWQDQYFEAVGIPEGLTRTGPKRRRLTREQWKAEKAAARAYAVALERAANASSIVVAATTEAEQIVDDAKEAAQKVSSKASNLIEAAQVLAEELGAGTLRRSDSGKIIARNPEGLKGGYPEIASAVKAGADSGTAIRTAQAEIAASKKQIETERAKIAAERVELAEERKTLRAQVRDIFEQVTSWMGRVQPLAVDAEIQTETAKAVRKAYSEARNMKTRLREVFDALGRRSAGRYEGIMGRMQAVQDGQLLHPVDATMRSGSVSTDQAGPEPRSGLDGPGL